MSQKLVILDAGAQYAKVIDRKVRELNVESEILPLDTPVKKLKSYQAIVISGGPESVYGKNAPKYDPRLFDLNIPILGICYGMQLLAYVAGNIVEKKSRREDGPCKIIVRPDSLLFKSLNKSQVVLMSHGDTVDHVAKDFRVIARSNGLIAAIENSKKKHYGVQFHPEVDLTEHGKDILRNFLYIIARFSGTYTMENRQEKAIRYIRKNVGKKKVLVLVSGGVDSTTCSALLAKALNQSQIYVLHIDNGFMRLNESKKVQKVLEKAGLNLIFRDASKVFYQATTKINGKTTLPLCETTPPEEKRKIIGDTFMRVSETAIQEMGLSPEDVFLVQGSLRPDLIESASDLVTKTAAVIKTHHNDTQLVRELRAQGRIIEPLQDYHKDEVRELGAKLGLPKEIVWRQPFPGPGLAIRIICAEKPYITKDFKMINRQLKQFNSSTMFATLLPIQTVGIQGDSRTFSYLVALSGKLSWNSLFRIAREIPKKIHRVNRVVYIFGNPIKGPITDITPTRLSKDVISQLQQADEIVNQILLEYRLIKTLAQVPIVSFPVHFGKPGNRSIGIRTFITNDFMTGVAAIPGKQMPLKALKKMTSQILAQVKGISRVAYDLTSKPPGTTEWE